jgi:hypothetical protein
MSEGDWTKFSNTEPIIEVKDTLSKTEPKVGLDKVLDPNEDTSDLYEIKELLKRTDSQSVIEFVSGKSVQRVALMREHLLTALAFSPIDDENNAYAQAYVNQLTRLILGDKEPNTEFDILFKEADGHVFTIDEKEEKEKKEEKEEKEENWKEGEYWKDSSTPRAGIGALRTLLPSFEYWKESD